MLTNKVVSPIFLALKHLFFGTDCLHEIVLLGTLRKFWFNKSMALSYPIIISFSLDQAQLNLLEAMCIVLVHLFINNNYFTRKKKKNENKDDKKCYCLFLNKY